MRIVDRSSMGEDMRDSRANCVVATKAIKGGSKTAPYSRTWIDRTGGKARSVAGPALDKSGDGAQKRSAPSLDSSVRILTDAQF